MNHPDVCKDTNIDHTSHFSIISNSHQMHADSKCTQPSSRTKPPIPHHPNGGGAAITPFPKKSLITPNLSLPSLSVDLK